MRIWRDDDSAGLRPGASDERLRAFEAAVGVELPAEVRRLYRLADGMEDYNFDDNFISFWSLERIEGDQDGFRRNTERQRHEITFADWGLFGAMYEVCICDDGTMTIERDGEPNASSLEEFADRCVGRLTGLYPPASGIP